MTGMRQPQPVASHLRRTTTNPSTSVSLLHTQTNAIRVPAAAGNAAQLTAEETGPAPVAWRNQWV